MRFINILSVFIVRKLSSLNDVCVVYGGVVMMLFEVVFYSDVIRNSPTLAMTRHGEVLFPILLEYPVGLFFSRFRSRRVR
jgi:ABC-type microcin C transport system permease subunit YejE